jgi:uncharacterized membrane protein YbaN (DUF454 family)
MSQPANRKTRIKKSLFVISGTICVCIGALGIVLPVLPTTPFLLLAATCYMRGSERMHKWLLNNRWFGRYIKNYREGKGISAKAKVFSISTLWITICLSVLFIDILPMQMALLLIGMAVSIHLIIRVPTFKE